FVTTQEFKKGRLLSINEEVFLFDQLGITLMHARQLGEMVRQEREKTIVRAVDDADSATRPVYRPNGSGTPRYAPRGADMNYIGSGNSVQGAPYNAAVPLVDWTDVELALRYRATQIKDDRIDGDPDVIGGVNDNLVLLVPASLLGTAHYVVNSTEVDVPI